MPVVFRLIISAGIETGIDTGEGFDFKSVNDGDFERSIAQKIIGDVRILIGLNGIQGIIIFGNIGIDRIVKTIITRSILDLIGLGVAAIHRWNQLGEQTQATRSEGIIRVLICIFGAGH